MPVKQTRNTRLFCRVKLSRLSLSNSTIQTDLLEVSVASLIQAL